MYIIIIINFQAPISFLRYYIYTEQLTIFSLNQHNFLTNKILLYSKLLEQSLHFCIKLHKMIFYLEKMTLLTTCTVRQNNNVP